MSTNLRAVFLHAASAAVMTYGYLHLPDVVANIRMAQTRGGHFQFLTIQGLCLAWMTMLLSLASDLAPSSKTFRRAKRIMLMTALPISIVISTVYWTLLTFMPHMILMSDPETTVPTSSGRIPKPERIPLHVDLALHAAPAISMFIDFYFLEPRFPKTVSRKGTIILSAIFGTWYSFCVEYCASYNGFFPYPFLTENPFSIRVLIYLAATSFSALSFMVLNAAHP
ncbi:FAR-17a/AIG1-like protein [Cubamyces menziesii]|nr:FAR-17a/AIG1-like protein [Cubamyces menziesii]